MANKRSIFDGAYDIYLTTKNIAVKRLMSGQDKNGRGRTLMITTYVPKTVGNLNDARKVLGYIPTRRRK